MQCTRRELLAAGTGAALGLMARADPAPHPQPRMGVVIHSYGIRRSADKASRFDDPLVFLEYCRSIGAGGVQTSLGVRDEAYAAKMRDALAKHHLYLEGSIALPRDQADLARFTAEVRTAKQCGVRIFRTVLMNGRRYEVFDREDTFRQFLAQGRASLALARPVVERHELRMAVENHKDLRAPELLNIVQKLDCPLAGVCVDTGNSIALLEPPGETVALLAPHALTTHIKDMGVAEYTDGFLLAEVPLGTGFLHLTEIVATLRRARPEIRLNLEMITRDPLQIPCLTRKYWVTLESIPGRRLAEMIALVRANAKPVLPRISELKREEQIRREDENVRQSLRHAAQG